MIFSGNPDSTLFSGFECTIDPQNLMNIVRAIFEKMKILNVFLMRTTLNLRIDRKRKKKKMEVIARGH